MPIPQAAFGGNRRFCPDSNSSGDCHASITPYPHWCCVRDLNSRYSGRKPDIIAKLDQRSMAVCTGFEPAISDSTGQNHTRLDQQTMLW